MGTWTLLKVKSKITERTDVYGNCLAIQFKLKYSPSRFGRYAEMPTLEWKEKITMSEKNARTWWEYECDQYARNPHSQTFNSWIYRYVNAYYSVRQHLYGSDEPSRLYDRDGMRLPLATFARANTPGEQADLVRSHLKTHGGIMKVIVVDKPGINRPANRNIHKDRFLTFDCGLRGCGQRVEAYQHLIVDGSKADTSWTRECALGKGPILALPLRLGKVNPPDDVTRVEPFSGSAINGQYR